MYSIYFTYFHRNCAGPVVFLMYEHYGEYQRHAMLTHVSLLINSTSEYIDVSPEVDYVFQFSLINQKSNITIFKTHLESEIPKWMKK